MAYIGNKGALNYLGTFKNIEDAVKARRKAEILYGLDKIKIV